jgi:hypothetical protein
MLYNCFVLPGYFSLRGCLMADGKGNESLPVSNY